MQFSRSMMAQQSKVTFKSIPHYPDLVIREAPCNVSSTWEEFLLNFGVDLKKVAPGFNFIVRSRKGLCYLSDKIDFISSKYIQKYRILVSVERESISVKTPRRRRRRQPKVETQSRTETENYVEMEQPTHFPQYSNYPEQPETQLPPYSGYVEEPETQLQQYSNYAEQPETQLPQYSNYAEQPETQLPPYSNYVELPETQLPQYSNYVEQPEPHLPLYSDLRLLGNTTYRTRIEKIDDYNVIQKSSVIWSNYGIPNPQQCSLRCFSMNDDEFNL